MGRLEQGGRRSDGRAAPARRAAVLTFVIALSACGVLGGCSSSKQGPGDAAVSYFNGFISGDAEAICSRTPDATVAELEERRDASCEAYLEQQMDQNELLGEGDGSELPAPPGMLGRGGKEVAPKIDLEVAKEDIHGDEATVILLEKISGELSGEITMIQEDGRWKVNDASEVDDGEDGEGSQSCETERRTLQTAAEAFYAQNSRYPKDATELVDEKFLRAKPTGHVLRSDGKVVAKPGGRCD